MSVQPSLFSGGLDAIRVTKAVVPVERKRLQRQCLDILALLRQRDAWNFELAEIARKYTGRLSEIRAAGYVVSIVEHDRKSGRCLYRLVNEPK